APGTRIVLGGASRIDPTTTPLVTVGASPTNQVAFPEDTTLSAAHAVLERSERGLLLRPLDGVSMVNRSICLKEAILHDGDEVRFTRATVVRVLAVD
ncbi:MAG: FHA domain-containing protein, partial [Proteobacteria bacterium]|nr:FHA domain-containing protein [Pseudomonadota bacterium]